MTGTWTKALALTAALASGAALGAFGQAQTSQTRREPQFKNENVRVWKSIIMPNQPLSLHRHEFGRTIVVLKGGSLDIVDAASKTMVVNGENVEGWMAAMTMTYVVDKADVFKTVKVGDQITAKVYDGDYTLHEVQVVPPKSPAKGKAAAKKK